ncbi:MAG TPA: FG-GAP-like repeat-containing protein [Geobacteraceae bacterium]|nr:FG-GAP-like repeat-containing protein [Geobacteraceae bacterium]
MTRAVKMLFGIMAGALVLAGCGGGGGGGGAQSGGVVDPAPAYKGVTTQASVSQANAEDLGMGGYGGGSVGSAIGSVAMGKGVANAPVADRPVLQVAQVLKQATRRLDIPRKASKRRIAKPAAAAAKVLQRIETSQVTGDGGGILSYTLDINDATGSFYGSLDFQNFTSQGIAISGKADMLGTFDASRQEFSRLTLSFKSLSMSGSEYSFTLIGTLSWGFNLIASTETQSINMVLQNNSDNQTYWFRNYELATTYTGTYLTQSLSGRYYDPQHGYVDFTTRSPLVTYSGNSWPSQGLLLFSGRQGGQGWLDFQATYLLIEADTDGNGAYEWQIRHETNSQPATNLPPNAATGPDQTVTQWSTVHLDGSASSDGNGDPISYSWTFASCPQNTCPGLTGANSATPSFPAELAGTYNLRLSVYDGQVFSTADTVDISVTPAVATAPNLLQEQWQYGIYGTSIGSTGLLVADLDGDGKQEIVAGASAGGFGNNSFWYVVRQASDGTYEQIWRSEQYPSPMVSILLADLSGDGKDDIVVALADGTVCIYDGPTRKEIRRLTVTKTLTALAVADLDGDGSKEIISSDGIGIFVHAADGSGLLWSMATGGGSSIAVGNVDGDAAPEIVTSAYGGKGYVIDGVTGTIEWEYINGFGAQIRLGDLDGDGMQEIVGAAAWYKITVFDADRRTPAWEVTTNLDIGALLVADTDGDGVPEILFGDSQWGKIHAVDVRTHADRWTVNNPEHGVSGIAFGDVDLDGTKELLWGAGGSSTGPDYLYIANPVTGTIEWQNKHVDGPLSAVAVGDVDDDGEDEIVMASFRSESGYAEGIIHIFNARTHALEYQGKLGIRDWMGVHSVKIGDVDNDGRTEFVVATADLYDAVIQVYDGTTHTLKRQSAKYNGTYFSALAIGDVDGDGQTEIVAGRGNYLFVFAGATLQEKWRSVDLGGSYGGVYDIKLADLDGDGHPELIASLADSRLVVYDGVNHDLKLLIEHPARALAVADVDGDGTLELLAGRTDGKIDVFDGKTFALRKSVPTFGKTAVDALRLADLDGNGTSEWLLASSGILTVLEGEGQGLKWRSRDLTGNLGLQNHLEVKDTDGDGRPELFIGADIALYQFKRP